jgi:hypothetical protein
MQHAVEPEAKMLAKSAPKKPRTYAEAAYRLKRTLKRLKKKSSIPGGGICLEDMKTLHDDFAAMWSVHPVFGPLATLRRREVSSSKDVQDTDK